jgi:hypothetical protein
MNGKSWTDLGMEQLEDGVSQVKQQVKQAPQSIANSVVSQVTGKTSSDKGSNEAGQSDTHQQQAHQQQSNEDFVKELYGPSENNAKSHADGEGKAPTERQKAAAEYIQEKVEGGMTPEEAQKLQSLRNKLHQEYYQKLISYEQPKPEERKADKMEKEKEQDEMRELEEQKKKDAPIAVQMGANKAEQFPGASG